MGILELLLVIFVILVIAEHFGYAPGALSGKVMNLIMLVLFVLLILWLIGALRGGPLLPYRVW